MGSTTATMTGMYTPGENTIEVTLAGAGLGNLYVQGKDTVIFTLTNAPAGVTVLGTNLPTSREAASSKKVTLTLSEDLKSTMYGATRVTLAYGATGAGVEDENRIISVGATADDDTRVADIIAGALMEMDIPPMLPSGMQTEYEFTVGDMVNVTLPPATGGNGNLTYALASQSEDISDGEIAFTPGTRKLMGTPTTADTYTVYYEVTDDNANLGMGEVTSGVDDEDVEQLTIEVVNPPGGPARYGRVVETWLTGVKEKTIGGKLRNHVAEGSTAVMLNVKVDWLVWELREIYGSRARLTGDDAFAELCVWIGSNYNMAEPAWVSMIDDEQDAHFPEAIRCGDRSPYSGTRSGVVKVPYPAKPAATEDNDAVRVSLPGKLRVYILEDDFEAENEVFQIEIVL